MEKILYEKIIRQYSDDGGLNWKDTDVWKIGDNIEVPSNCTGEYVEGCFWKQLPISEGYICDGLNKCYKLEEICNNNGIFRPSGNIKPGAIYEENSTDCYGIGNIKFKMNKVIPGNYCPDNVKLRINGHYYYEIKASGCIYSATLEELGVNYIYDCNYMFYSVPALTNIIELPDTSNVTDMSYMFNGSYAMFKFDYKLKTSSTTNMSHMFEDSCNDVDNKYDKGVYDLSNFDTSMVTDMSYMFAYCYKLETIDMSNWVINDNCKLDLMFNNCNKLKTILMRNCQQATIDRIIAELTSEGIIDQVAIITDYNYQNYIANK